MSAPPPADAAARIRELGAWLSGTDVALLELRTPAEAIRLVRPPGAASPPRAETPPVTVRAPAPGLFLSGHPARAEPLAAPGRAVRAGEVVALLRVGALLLHVRAPADGTVIDVPAREGELVGHGAPLLHLRRSTDP